MSFYSRPAKIGLAALVSILCLACSVFESQDNEFPDAGPNGPDSLYAGVGQGIPFGEVDLPTVEFRSPYTGAVLTVRRDNVASYLRAAQTGKLRLVLNLAGASRRYTNPDETFNLELWKARIDLYRDVDFGPYVTEGLVLAHFLVDEPGAAATWGGQPISRATIEEMARYSKSIWPTLPTAVRAPPQWLLAGDTSYQSLDIAWAQWAGPLHGAGTGLTPEQFRDKNVALAKQLGLGLVFGMNYLNGGDGSSGIPGTASHPNQWQMSPAELVNVGTLLIQAPYSCAFLSWHYAPEYLGRPDVRAALDSIAAAAATRGGTSCLRHDSTAATPAGD
jgi:hypothetical protein